MILKNVGRFIVVCMMVLVLVACTIAENKAKDMETTQTPQQEILPQNTDQIEFEDESLPTCVEKEYVIVQDYADSETSKTIRNDLATALNKETSILHDVDERIQIIKRRVFILCAAVPFEGGILVCGHYVQDGEITADLYYLENGDITYRTPFSDIWSLNYTIFKGHTITYGKPIESKNVVRVSAEFANGETKNMDFSNTMFMGQENWPDGCITTNGYILMNKGETWVKSLEFYREDGSIEVSWHDAVYNFKHAWIGQPCEIWNTCSFNEMTNEKGFGIKYDTSKKSANEVSIFEQSPTFLINDENDFSFIETFLMDECGLEYIWRNNNHIPSMREIKRADELTVTNVKSSDEIIWVAIDKDDGSEILDYDNLCSNIAPCEKGNYCLIIKRKLKHSSPYEYIYFSVFVRLI